GELQRLAVVVVVISVSVSAESRNFQHKLARELVRVYKTVRRNIQRTDAIVIALRGLAWLSAWDGNLPDLPVVVRAAFPREQHVLSIEGDACIRGGDETGNQRSGALTILNENRGPTWESFRSLNPRHGAVFTRNRVQQRKRRCAV